MLPKCQICHKEDAIVLILITDKEIIDTREHKTGKLKTWVFMGGKLIPVRGEQTHIGRNCIEG